VRDVGAGLRAAVVALGHPLVTEVRGEGLLIAIELSRPVAAQVATRALGAGFIVNPCTPTVLRLAPPFILTAEQAATFTAFLAELPHDLEPES
jgi:acetylornithine/N-succinyldiaminopimelate aminotransferase